MPLTIYLTTRRNLLGMLWELLVVDDVHTIAEVSIIYFVINLSRIVLHGLHSVWLNLLARSEMNSSTIRRSVFLILYLTP